jgi:hypothetical protein
MADIAVPNKYTTVSDEGISSLLMFQWMVQISTLLEQGYTGTVTTAALTPGGTQGSMVFENGILLSQVQAT